MEERWTVAHQLLQHWSEDVLKDEETPDRESPITQNLDQSFDQVDELLIRQILLCELSQAEATEPSVGLQLL